MALKVCCLEIYTGASNLLIGLNIIAEMLFAEAELSNKR